MIMLRDTVVYHLRANVLNSCKQGDIEEQIKKAQSLILAKHIIS